MPVLSNINWERFCQMRAAGLPQYKAYMQCGFKPGNKDNAHKLANTLAHRPEIKDRIREIITEAVGSMKVTIESLAAELDQAIELAHEQNNPSAIVAAVQAKAKLFEMGIDHKVVTVNHQFAEMSEDELMFVIAGLNAEIRAIKAGKVRTVQ
jgi:hypothetical protein